MSASLKRLPKPVPRPRLSEKQVGPVGPQGSHYSSDRDGKISVDAGAQHLADRVDARRHVANLVARVAAVHGGIACEALDLIIEVVQQMQALPHEQQPVRPGIMQGQTALVAQRRGEWAWRPG